MTDLKLECVECGYMMHWDEGRELPSCPACQRARMVDTTLDLFDPPKAEAPADAPIEVPADTPPSAA